MHPAVPIDVQRAYQKQAFLASKGDPKAETALAEIEAQIAAHERNQRRLEAAETEAAARLAEVSERREERERQAMQKLHEDLLAARQAAHVQVEAATARLAEVVRVAIAAGNEVHASSIGLGLSPGRVASHLIADYVGQHLNEAGLHDFPRTRPATRQPLVDAL